MNFGALNDGLGCFPLTTELIPRSLTASLWSYGIRSLIGFGKLVGPLVLSELYPRN